ncbi:MATH and LRR domain-containing protein PFE0570w isoform X2 [Hydra vulgaris]|uniref:MATH and LRR domain-containing protein PFE0570w isoform X2 n=1 Tax=Hydra vulgaris TaxID=6087 RepID=UPI001F5EE3A8|nr:MATH and LRR domain-containing protein PFE0570w isoform X2 [Hydra vulgaris]
MSEQQDTLYNTDFLIMEYFAHKIIKMFLEEYKGCINNNMVHLMNAWKVMVHSSDGIFSDEMRNLYILISLIVTCCFSSISQVDQLNLMLEMINTQGQEFQSATEDVSNVCKFLHTKIFLKLLDNGCGKGAKQYLRDHDVLCRDSLEQLVSKDSLPENLKPENLKNVCFSYVSEVYKKIPRSRLVLLFDNFMKEKNNTSQVMTLIPKETDTTYSSSSEPMPNSYQSSTTYVEKESGTFKDSPCIPTKHKLSNDSFKETVDLKYSKNHLRKSFKYKGSYKIYNTRSDKKVTSNLNSHMYISDFKKSFTRDNSKKSDDDMIFDDVRSDISDSQTENLGIKCYVDINKVISPKYIEKKNNDTQNIYCEQNRSNNDNNETEKNNTSNHSSKLQIGCQNLTELSNNENFCSVVSNNSIFGGKKKVKVENIHTNNKACHILTNNQINYNYKNLKTKNSDQQTSADSDDIYIKTSADLACVKNIDSLREDVTSKDTSIVTPASLKKLLGDEQQNDSKVVFECVCQSSKEKTVSSSVANKKSIVNSDESGTSCKWSDDEFEVKYNPTVRVPFSKDEEKYIKEGIKKFGIGNWCKIKRSYPFHPNRTNVSIKDKYRTMKRQGIL